MRKALLSAMVLSGFVMAAPAFAQLGGNVTGGVAGAAGAAAGAGGIDTPDAGVGGGAGAGVGSDIGVGTSGVETGTKAGAGASGKAGAGTSTGAGAGAGVSTGTSADTHVGVSGASMTAHERSAAAAASGITLDLKHNSGLIGRSVVGADGKVLGTIKAVNADAKMNSVEQVVLKGTGGGKSYLLDRSKLTTGASGGLMASGLSKANLGTLAAADATAKQSAGFIGKAVIGADGKALGTIENLAIDSKTGAVQQVILRPSSGQNPKLIAIERSKLTADAAGKITAPKLTSAEFEALTVAQSSSKVQSKTN